MTSTSGTLRASIYCRVSTAEQVDGTSLDSQRAVCERYCAARGWTIHAVFVDDGVSGAARSRPALDELRDSIRRRQTDVVVVAKLDRLGRTVRGLVEWMSEWDDEGVALVSVSEAFDSSSPAARMQRNLLAMFAEFERDRIAERTSEGRDATVAIGGWPGGPAPFGWRLVRTPSDRFTRLELDKNEAETIRRAVHLFVDERRGSTEIFRTLNAEGRPSRGGPGRTQRTTWSTSKVKQLLSRSDSWAGTWTYRSRSIGHPKNVNGPPIQMRIPPLLSAAELTALRVRLAETSTPRFGPGSRDPYLLSRRVTSPHGTPMYGSWRKQRATAHYMCGHTQETSGWPRCGCHTIEVTALDDLVWQSITDRLLDDIVGDADDTSRVDLSDSANAGTPHRRWGNRHRRHRRPSRTGVAHRDRCARRRRARRPGFAPANRRTTRCPRTRQRLAHLPDLRRQGLVARPPRPAQGEGPPTGRTHASTEVPHVSRLQAPPRHRSTGILPALSTQTPTVGPGTPFRIVTSPEDGAPKR